MRKMSGRSFFAIGLVMLCCSLGFALPALAGGWVEYVMPSGYVDTCYEYTDMSALLSRAHLSA